MPLLLLSDLRQRPMAGTTAGQGAESRGKSFVALLNAVSRLNLGQDDSNVAVSRESGCSMEKKGLQQKVCIILNAVAGGEDVSIVSE